jgi:hypothetical protein
VSETTGMAPAATSYELRPLSMAETLDAGYQILRNHFALLGALSLVGQIPSILVFSLFSWMLDPFALQDGSFPEIGAAFVIGVGLWLLAMILLIPVVIGAITTAVSDVYLGAPLSLRDCLQAGVSRMFPLMVTYVIFTLVLTVAMVLVMLVIVAGGSGLAVLAQGSLGIALLVILGLAAIPAIFALAGLLALIPGILAAVVVLEQESLFQAIARTWTLVVSQLGRLCALGVVLYMLVMIVPMGAQLMVGAVPIVGAVVWGCLQALCQAYLYTTTVVAYFDIRCRLESFDLEHLAQLVEGSSPTASPIR